MPLSCQCFRYKKSKSVHNLTAKQLEKNTLLLAYKGKEKASMFHLLSVIGHFCKQKSNKRRREGMHNRTLIEGFEMR